MYSTDSHLRTTTITKLPTAESVIQRKAGTYGYYRTLELTTEYRSTVEAILEHSFVELVHLHVRRVVAGAPEVQHERVDERAALAACDR